jgi:cytosine/adenosine deaminase-related metal-dependent hydrolase
LMGQRFHRFVCGVSGYLDYNGLRDARATDLWRQTPLRSNEKSMQRETDRICTHAYAHAYTRARAHTHTHTHGSNIMRERVGKVEMDVSQRDEDLLSLSSSETLNPKP